MQGADGAHDRRVRSADGAHGDGPEQLAIRKRYVEERYKLLPYIYALADENSRTGDPIMRPVFYDYPDALTDGCDRSISFTLGRSLLIAGPPKPESPAAFDICLPAGGWYDYWTGLLVGQSKLTQVPRLDKLPVFALRVRNEQGARQRSPGIRGLV